MPKPIKRRELIRRLRLCGWQGPEPGGKHEVMRHTNGNKIPIPNPHRGDLDWTVVKRVIREAGISAQHWDGLGQE
ncbi:MAG: type II toxin-antitoxin system HicA family toxin [Chthoniobacter sp.]|uniref:type II toxin-antitoxin system HicA family toxin n=1 Tax=Chthoniobacter sp. TaxID=2510640 RepID=UPI0032A88D67